MAQALLLALRPAQAVCAFSCALIISLSLATTHAAPAQKSGAPSSIQFEDVTRSAGIHFTHNNAASGKKWLPETMGSGVAFLDYDNDGWQYILLAR